MSENLVEYIATILRDKFDIPLPQDAVSPDAGLEDLGVDSLVYIELALILRRDFGVQLAEEELAAARSLGDLADLVGVRIAVA